MSLLLSTARDQGTKDMEKDDVVRAFLPFLLLALPSELTRPSIWLQSLGECSNTQRRGR